jgi:AraC-like DNA-binding protein
VTTHPVGHHGVRSRVGSNEPLAQYPLIATSDIGEAESRGAQLLSEYRLGVKQELSFDARVNGCSLGGVDLYYTNFGSTEVDVASAALADRFGIVIPLAGSMHLRYKSRDIDAVAGSSAVIISPDADFRMRWSESFCGLVLRIQKSNFVALARSVVPQAEAEDLSFEPLISRPASLQSVRGALQVLYECLTRAGSAEQVPPLLASRAREQLVTTLLMVQPNDLVGRLYQPSGRIGHRAVREAVDLVESETASVGTVAELARRVGVTARSLQIGFQREMGVSPASYMHNVRLARAHEELLLAQPGDGVTVGDVALRWGFQHAGRFAVYYRQRFGESPSKTLRTQQ